MVQFMRNKKIPVKSLQEAVKLTSLVPPFSSTSAWQRLSTKLSCQNLLQHHSTQSLWMRSLASRPLHGMVGLQNLKQMLLVHPVADLTTWPLRNWDHYCVTLQLSEFPHCHGMVALVASGEDLVASR